MTQGYIRSDLAYATIQALRDENAALRLTLAKILAGLDDDNPTQPDPNPMPRMHLFTWRRLRPRG